MATTQLSNLILATILFATLHSTLAIDVETKGACSKPCQLLNDDTFLNCYDCNCTTVPFENIKDDITLYHLTSINLDNNEITDLPKLPSMSNLISLDLSNNLITNLDDDIFMNCPKLKYLNFTNNFINTIDYAAFYGLSHLEFLSLGENSLKTLDHMAFSQISPTLLTLNLSSNAFTFIAPQSISLSALQVLHLEHNKINKVEKFWLLTSLMTLHLEDNELEDIGSDFFESCEDLEVLYLQDNRLANLTEKTFRYLSKVQFVHLQDNIVTSLAPKTFAEMKSLNAIYLDGNPVVEVSAGVFPPSVQAVSLTRTHTLSTVKNLTFTDLPNLSRVFLNDNRFLDTIESDAFGRKSSAINSLDLSNNALTTLDEDLVDYSKLINLDLAGNKWDCDCHLAWLSQIIVEPAGQGVNARCVTPYHLQGSLVSRVPFEAFSCDIFSRYRYRMGLALIALVTSIFILIIACLVTKYRQRVIPCVYKEGKQYQALYDAREVQRDDPAVSVQWQDGKEGDRLTGDGPKEPV